MLLVRRLVAAMLPPGRAAASEPWLLSWRLACLLGSAGRGMPTPISAPASSSTSFTISLTRGSLQVMHPHSALYSSSRWVRSRPRACTSGRERRLATICTGVDVCGRAGGRAGVSKAVPQRPGYRIPHLPSTARKAEQHYCHPCTK